MNLTIEQARDLGLLDLGDQVKRRRRDPSKYSEEKFTQDVLELAGLLGWRTAHFRPGMNRRGAWMTAVAGNGKGFFDIIAVRDRVIAAELKMPGRKPRPDQKEWAIAFERAGVEAYTWRPSDWKEIEAVLRGGRP